MPVGGGVFNSVGDIVEGIGHAVDHHIDVRDLLIAAYEVKHEMVKGVGLKANTGVAGRLPSAGATVGCSVPEAPFACVLEVALHTEDVEKIFFTGLSTIEFAKIVRDGELDCLTIAVADAIHHGVEIVSNRGLRNVLREYIPEEYISITVG